MKANVNWGKPTQTGFCCWFVEMSRRGVPTVVRRDHSVLGALGRRFSPCQCVRIQHCHSCSLHHSSGSDLIPGLGTPYATGEPKKKKRKKDALMILAYSQGRKPLTLTFLKLCFLPKTDTLPTPHPLFS